MGSSTTRRSLALLSGLVMAASLVACSGSAAPPATKPKPSASSRSPTQLTFAVYGPPQVVTAYTKAAGDFTSAHPNIVVDVKTYPNQRATLAAVASATTDGPDVFLADRSDVPAMANDHLVQAVDGLLGERGVDFGDGFQRNALEQFSADSHLQCMPLDFSPMVLYYNTDLLDVSEIERGTTPHDPTRPFNMTEWATAASLATGPGHRGVYVAPTFEQIAPFVWSAGGNIVDDPAKPTRLDLESGGSSKGMEQLLEVVRDPSITFSKAAIANKSAVRRFESGQLGMILGYRNLVPQFRATPGLQFDTMPLPRIGSVASIGTSTGACIPHATRHTAAAADFVAYLASDTAQNELAQTGYVVPTSLDVDNDDAFLQPNLMPAHAGAFTSAIRGSRELPTGADWRQVVAVTAGELSDLFYDPVIDPLEDRLKVIDATSAPIFVPPTPSATPTPTPTG